MTRRLFVLTLALVVVAGAMAWLWPRHSGTSLTADFRDTTGLYPGNDVTYLGVPVGSVTGIDRDGTFMRVHLRLDPGTQIPRDAGAEILQASLVTDRHVELGPAYRGGPTLNDGAHIPLTHTRRPAGIDDITASLDRLVRALDAPGARADLGTLVHLGATTLNGNGTALRDAIVAGTKAMQTVNGRGPAILRVSHQLAVLVQALARREEMLRHLSTPCGPRPRCSPSRGTTWPGPSRAWRTCPQ